jgi:outer membrane protein insertion porin family
VSTSAPPAILAEAGKAVTSKMTLSPSQDTRDKIINTTRGHYTSLDLGLAGGPLGGDNNYYSIELRGSRFIPIAAFQEQVISLIGRTGVIDAYGDSAKLQIKTITDPTTGQPISFVYYPGVPFYDRYFLGGPQTLRGFEFRTVGPKSLAGEPTGGNTYGFLSLEYSLDVVKPVRFAIFYDAGFVNARAYDFSPAHYNDNFGFGLRLFVAGAPLSLDLGIPLTTDRYNDHGSQFNFSFGTRF